MNSNEGEQPQRQNDDPPNPFKAKGNIAEHWFRRLNVQARDDKPPQGEEDTGADQDDQETKEENGGTSAFEHAYQGENARDQVLGAVEEEVDAAHIPMEQENEKLSEPNDQNDDAAVDDDTTAEPMSTRKRPFDDVRSEEPIDRLAENQAKKMALPPDEDQESDSNEDKEIEKDSNDDHPIVAFDMDKLVKDPTRDGQGQSQKLEEHDNSEEELSAETLRSLWETKRVHEPEVARELWERYKQATSSHAQRLCEQLRLILEPTLASKLQVRWLICCAHFSPY